MTELAFFSDKQFVTVDNTVVISGGFCAKKQLTIYFNNQTVANNGILKDQ